MAISKMRMMFLLILFNGYLARGDSSSTQEESSESSSQEECDSSSSGDAPPNIIFILTDDMGYADVSWNNNDVVMPNLDALAQDGVILDRNYMQPLCTPSRAALMTGKYAYHVGWQHDTSRGGAPSCLDLNEKILPEYLKDEGYATHMLGKWHLGYCKWECTPLLRGFDSFYGFYNGFIDWYSHQVVNGYDWRDGNVSDTSVAGIYATHLIRDRSVELIQDHDCDKPLFMYISHGIPHLPVLVPPGVEEDPAGTREARRNNYLAMITDMDASVGAVVQALKDKGLYENSIIIFTSDNGGQLGPASNEPLRGMKSSVYEGGTRVPGFVHTPLPIMNTRGTVSEEMIHVSDWLTTITSLAGNPIQNADMDGVDQTDMIMNGGPSGRNEFVYNIDQYEAERSFGKAAIRMGDYKLILGYPGTYDGWEQYDNMCYTWEADHVTGVNPVECTANQLGELRAARFFDFTVIRAFTDRIADNVMLFNVMDDPSEEVNLADSMPGQVALMRARMDVLAQSAYDVDRSIMTPIPESNPNFFGGAWSPGFC